MDIPNIKVALVCLFCNAPLQGTEEIKFSSGDLIRCTQCGEQNDFDSVLEVAKEKGMVQAENAIKEQLQKDLKNLFKKTP
jgi:DNA-directed RNA polymerase subunit RPC12/RpoP